MDPDHPHAGFLLEAVVLEDVGVQRDAVEDRLDFGVGGAVVVEGVDGLTQRLALT